MTSHRGNAIGWFQWIVGLNLALVGLQAVSAGFFLSGYGRAGVIHAATATALQLGALVQAAAAIVQWRRRRVPAALASMSVGLLVMLMLQAGLGYRKVFWLHVPLGVGLFAGLTRHMHTRDTSPRVT